MTKPTFKQKLFRQPTQTYASNVSTDTHPYPSHRRSNSRTTSISTLSVFSPISSASALPQHSVRVVAPTNLSKSGNSNTLDSDTAPDTNRYLASFHQDEALNHAGTESLVPLKNVDRPVDVAIRNSHSPRPVVTAVQAVADDSDSDEDQFYTPLTSPATSPCASPRPTSRRLELPSMSVAIASLPSPPVSRMVAIAAPPTSSPDLLQSFSGRSTPGLTNPSASSSFSVLSSSESLSQDDVFSNYSWYSDRSDFTPPTSAPTSDQGHGNISENILPSLDRVVLSAHKGSSRSSRSRPLARSTQKPAEWAKDVKWLAPDSLEWTPPDGRTEPKPASPRNSGAFSNVLIPTMEEMANPYYHNTSPRSSVIVTKGGEVRRGKRSQRNSVELDRMSFILEEDEGGDPRAQSSAPPSLSAIPPHLRSTRSSSPRRTRTRSAPRSRTPSVTSFPSVASSSRTVTLPTPLPVLDVSQNVSSGYTSLVLPRAAYTPSKKPEVLTDKVDLTRSGLAQTTMSSVSISKGAAEQGSMLFTRKRRISLPSGFKPSTTSSPTPSHLLSNAPTPLSFTSRTPPPSKLTSSSILVQVTTVALDSLDALIVEEKATKNEGFGFVPGRSFVGRVIECGFEVKHVVKGDWVFGLLELSKCGALAEFIVVDRRRISRAPTPHKHLTLEQIALLPLAGIPAHRVCRTLSLAKLRGKTALVLQAHDGIGALVTQELTSLGVTVIAQVVPDQLEDEITAEERARLFGAAKVIVEEPLVALTGREESSCDFVIDTVGGRRIWEAARWALRDGGQFTTVVGDSPSAIPSMNAHFKSNLRSLRRAFLKQGRKSIGYEWVSPAADVDTAGDDVRDSLVTLGSMAEYRVVVPLAKRALKFERTPQAFEGDKIMFANGGTVLVQLLG